MMKALVVALILVAAPVGAQPRAEMLTPQITPGEFAKLDLLRLPGSAFSPGWDAFASIPLANGLIGRFFYRAGDGLMVGVLEDYFGNIYNQRAWKLAPGFTQFDVTKYVIPGDLRPVATLTFFFYNRQTGEVQRFWVAWIEGTTSSTTALDSPTR